MLQLFRDLLRDARPPARRSGSFGSVWAVARLWLRVGVETIATAAREHAAEIRRLIMETNTRTGQAFSPSAVMGFLFAAVVIAGGLLAKVFILEFGGTIFLATGVAITLNLASALIMERAISGRGIVLFGVGLVITATLLPLLWVADSEAWLRENPVNGFIVILVAAWSMQGRPRWPILAVAGFLGAAQIAVSFF
jgi:hypothetical protein